MDRQFKEGEAPAPEKIEDQKYATLQVAMYEENRIMKEISNVFATTSNQADAEKVVLKEYAFQMDEAMRKSRSALDEWLNIIKEAGKKEIE